MWPPHPCVSNTVSGKIHIGSHTYLHTDTYTSGQWHNPVKLMNGYTLGQFKQQMFIHFTCALSDRLCQAIEYEWDRLTQISGLCWQIPASSRPLTDYTSSSVFVHVSKGSHYFCICEGWWSCRRTWKPHWTCKWCLMRNRAGACSLNCAGKDWKWPTQLPCGHVGCLMLWAPVAVKRCWIS